MAGAIDKEINDLEKELGDAPLSHVDARANILSDIALSREFADTFLKAVCQNFTGNFSLADICENLAKQRAICYGARELKTVFKKFDYPPVTGSGTVNGALDLTEPNTSFMGIKATNIDETYTINLSSALKTETQDSNTFSVYTGDYYLVRSRVTGELIDVTDDVTPYSTPDTSTVFGNAIAWGSSVASEEEANTWNYNWAKANIAGVSIQSIGAFNELTVIKLSDGLTSGSNAEYTPLGSSFGQKFYLKRHADYVNTFTIIGTTAEDSIEVTGVSDTDIAKIKFGDVISGTGIPDDNVTIAAVQTADSKLRLSNTGIATANGTVTLTVNSVPFGFAAHDIFCQIEIVAEGLIKNDNWKPTGNGAGGYSGVNEAADDTLTANTSQFIGLLGFFDPANVSGAGENDLTKGASATFSSEGKEYNGTQYPDIEKNPIKPSVGGTNKAYEVKQNQIIGTQPSGLGDKDIWTGRFIRFDKDRADASGALPEFRYVTNSAEKFYYELPANSGFTCGNYTTAAHPMPNAVEPPASIVGKTALIDAITTVRGETVTIGVTPVANTVPVVPDDDAIVYVANSSSGSGLSTGTTTSDKGFFYLMESNNIITTNKVTETKVTSNSTTYTISYANHLVAPLDCVYNYVQRHLYHSAAANADVAAVESALDDLQAVGVISFRDPIIGGTYSGSGQSDDDFDANCATHLTTGPDGTLTVLKAMQLSFEAAFGDSDRVAHPEGDPTAHTHATGDSVDYRAFPHGDPAATVNAHAQWVSFSNAWGTLSGALTARIAEIDARIGTPTYSYRAGTTVIVDSLTIIDGGVTYTAGTLSGSGGGGTGFAGTYTVDVNGTIDTVTITAPGSGYTSAPTIVISHAGDSNASIRATITGTALAGTSPTVYVSAVPASNTTGGFVPYGRSLYNNVNHLLGQDVDLLGGIIKDIESLTDLVGLVKTARNKYEIFNGRDKEY